MNMSTAGAARPPIKLSIEAPNDVHVEQVDVFDGPVKNGQQLIVLKSFNIERIAIHLAAFKEHIAIAERPFRDGRIDAEISALKQKADLLAEIKQIADKDVKRRNEIYNVMYGPNKYNTTNPPPPDASNLQLVKTQTTQDSTTKGNPSDLTGSITRVQTH